MKWTGEEGMGGISHVKDLYSASKGLSHTDVSGVKLLLCNAITGNI